MSYWEKRKRLETTIMGEPADRPPVALWRHWPGDDQDAAALAAAHLKWQQDYDWDLVKVSPSSSYCLVDWGVEDRWAGSLEGTREYTVRAIHQPEDWAKLPVLDPGKGMLAEQIECLRLIGEGLGEETPFLATIFSPLAQAKNLSGGERMLSHMRSHPDAFNAGLKTITRSTLNFIEAAKETGISGIFYATQHCRYHLMSPQEFNSFGRTYDLRILSETQDLWLNMLHIHGEDIMFKEAADYPVQLVNWHDRDSDMPLSEGMKRVKGAVSGGVSRWTLYQEGPAATLAEARGAMEQTGGRRFMLGVGCVAMTNTPLRNIRALREFVDKG
ncbi:MAG: uroporphyrinogen decarboxylase family protein [Candidatus Promineifilaceae bacterium]